MSIAGVGPVSRHDTLAEDVYQKLRMAIMSGALSPGEKISARNVAQSAQVSLTPAREAVSRLISEGALELVGPKTVAVPQISREALDEITTIRVAVEGLAAEIAAQNITSAEVDEIEAIQVRYEKTRNTKGFRQSLAINEAFHFKIYQATRMPRLVSYIETLWLQMGPSFNLFNSTQPLSNLPIDFHRQAVQGLRDSRPDAVKAAIQSDIRFGYERLRTLISA